jgi:hypothetical protein
MGLKKILQKVPKVSSVIIYKEPDRSKFLTFSYSIEATMIAVVKNF